MSITMIDTKKTEEENPTIGVLLCNEKNDAMVELTLPEDSNIYASQYKLYLPDKKLLQDKLKEWLQEEGGAEDEIYFKIQQYQADERYVTD